MAKKKNSLAQAFMQKYKAAASQSKSNGAKAHSDKAITSGKYVNTSRTSRSSSQSSSSSSRRTGATSATGNRSGSTRVTTTDPRTRSVQRRTTTNSTTKNNTTSSRSGMTTAEKIEANKNNVVQSRINPRGVETSTQKKQSWENKAGDIKESRGFKAAELGVKGALNSTKATFDAARNPNEDKYVKAKEYKEAQGINVDEKIKKYEGQYGQLLRSEQDKREWRETALEKDQKKADKINAEYQDLKDKTKSKVGKFALDVVKTGSEMAVDAGTSLVTGTGPVGYFGSMASRVVGQSYLDAKSRGATDDEAAAYAFAEAGKEVGTEGMFAPAGKLGKTIFGGGYAGSVAGDLSDKVANKLTGNVNGKFLKDIVYGGTKTGFSMLEEGIEEMVSEGLDPMVANALYQKSVTQRNQQQFRNELDQKVKSGEVTQAQADAYYEQNKDKLDITTQFNLGDVAYSGLLGGALGMLGGGVNSLSQNMAGARATEIYGDEGIKKLAEGLVDIDETPGADVSSQAKAVAQMIKSGEKVSNGQVAEMVQAAQQQQQRNDNNFSDSIGAAQKIINDNGHVNPVNMSIQPDENGNPQIVPTLSENTAKVYAQSIEDGKQAITNVLDENGISMSEEQIQSVGEAIADVQMGLALDSSTVEMFTLSHPAERAALETALGIKLPETNEGTRAELNKMIAENLVETAKTEYNTVRDQLKGLVHQTETTGYGRNGQMEFASRLGDEQINAMSGSQVMGYAETFDKYYRAGMSGDYSLEKMDGLNNPTFNAVPEGARRAAYTAGMRDRMSAQNLLNGQLVEKGKSISKDIQKAKQKGSKASGTVTFAINNENRKSLGYARSKMWQSVANALGIDIVLADVENMQRLGNDDSIHSGINGFYNPKTDTIVINIDAKRGLDYTLIHEVTHYIRLTAPEEYNKLASLVVDRWSRRGGMMNAIEQKKKTYDDLTDEQILEEIIADSTYEFLLDEGFVEEVAKSSPTLAQRLLEAIKYVAKRLRAMIADGNLPDLENEDLFSQLDILKEAETLWLDAYKKAVENSVATDGMARMSQSQLDNEYQKAYENGDTETAQRLVDEAARRAGYDVEAWHGSMNDEFNTFDRAKIRSGSGFWFSENKGTAEGYSFGESNLRKYLLDLRNNKYIDASNSNWATIPRDLDPSRAVGTILGGFEEENNRWEFEISFHDDHTENYSLDAQPDDVEALSKWAAATIPHMNNEGADKFAERLVEDGWVDEYDENLAGYYGYGSDGSLVTTDELSDEALTNGYDSLTIANVEDGGDYTEATNHIVNNPSQIKLADPFTFDDKGELIPLSQRFNTENEDIRYSKSVDEAISKYPDDPKMKNWHQETTEDATIIDRINEANIRYSVQPMNILVACEESQAVVKELRKLGHNAYSCDIQDQSGGHPEWHVMGDVSPMLNGSCDFTTTDGQQHNQNGKWDMIIAFPPCTHLALSGARWFEQKREDGRQREAIEFFASFFEADCDKLVVENPSNIIGGDYIQKHFPDLYEKYEGARTKPSQRIQPWMFGDNAQKTTCLWLKGVPELSPMETEVPDDLEFVEYTRANGKKVRLPKWYSNASGNRGKTRSKTFKGVAENMARQFAGDARPDIRYSMGSAEMDAAYEDALFDDDEETMRAILDEASATWGYTYRAYHHTENYFTEFDLSKARRNMDIQGFYFSADPDAEAEYGSINYDTYLKMENPYVIDSKAKNDAIPVKFGENNYGVKVRDWLLENGYDSVIRAGEYYGGADEYIVLKPTQIKSAELVVSTDEYGDDIIMPSQRFDDSNPDIRFSAATEKNDYPKAANPMTGSSVLMENGSAVMISGRKARENAMRDNGFSEAAIKNVNDYFDSMISFIQDDLGIKYRFIGLNDVKNAKVKVRYKNGEPDSIIMSAMLKNGEYPVNFDFSAICKKREGMMQVIKALVNTPTSNGSNVFNSIELTDEQMWKINNALREEGFETACLGCFVEARRYNSHKFYNKIETVWNEKVRKARKKLGLPEEEYFNFADTNKALTEITDKDMQSVEDVWAAYEESTASKKSPNKRIQLLMDTIVKNKDVNSPYLKLISPSDVLTPEGIEGFKTLSTKGHDLVKTIKSFYGTSAPKEILAFTPYNSEIAMLPEKKGDMSIRDYLKSIGGVRTQSFSDFKIENFFDYMQMIADMAARKFTGHAYTKEISFAKIFGKTGMKINLSVMFDIDNEFCKKYGKQYAGLQFIDEADLNTDKYFTDKSIPYSERKDKRYAKAHTLSDGRTGYLVYLVGDKARSDAIFEENYQKNLKAKMTEERARELANMSRPFTQSIDMDEAIELQNRDGYRENVGIIAVAYSDEHMKMLLEDPEIRYIIPYHKSGLPKFVSNKSNMDYALDFTKTQNTNKNAGIKKPNGKKYDTKHELSTIKKNKDIKYPYIELYKRMNAEGVTYAFGKKSTAQKTAMAGTADYDVYEHLSNSKDPKAVVNEYLKYCEDNNYIPIFPEYAGSEGYYKVLFDFSITDGNEVYEQREVTNTYPAANNSVVDITQETGNLDELKSIIDSAAEEQNNLNMERNQKMGKVVDKLLRPDSDYNLLEGTNIQAIKYDEIDYSNPKYTLQGEDEPNNQPRFSQSTPIDNEHEEILNKLDAMLDDLGLDLFTDPYSSYDIGSLSRFMDAENKSEETMVERQKRVAQMREIGSLFPNNHKNDGLKAGWKPERIDMLISESGASNPDYAKSYATSIHPRDFLKLTLPDDMLDKWNADEGNDSELYSLDEAKLTNNTQTPFLIVDEKTGEVIGHEGRHRMRALLNAGFTSVPVVIRDENTKYTKRNRDELVVTSQEFAGDDPVNNAYGTTLFNLIPIKEPNRDEIVNAYGNPNADIRFSQRDAEYMAAIESGNMTKVQQMVDEAAKRAGYVTAAWHGTNEEFNSFKGDDKYYHPGMYFSSSDNVAKSYGDNTKSLYLDLGNSLEVDAMGNRYHNIRWKPSEYETAQKYTVDELAERAYRMGYNSLTVNNVMDVGSKNGIDTDITAIDYVAFNPSQIKSADPITYDDNGEIIPLSERFNAENEDIRFSKNTEDEPLPEDVIYDYMADHPEEFEQMWTSAPEDSNYVQHRAETLESLKAQVQKLKQNQKKTEGKILDESSVRSDFNDMVKAMLQASSEGRGTKKTDNKLVKQAVNNAKIMFNYFHSGDTENMTLTALSAAEDMVDGLKFINDDVYTYYKDLRDYLKTAPVKVDDTIKSDIPDYAEWKKAQWGRIRIANEGIPVDVMYGELCGMFPDMFDSAISNPTDMLLRMGEAMEGVQPYAVYLSSEERAALVSQVASDMIRITMLGKPYQSMVDRYEDKLKAAKQRATEAERDKSKYQRELWKANERTAKADDKLLAQQMAAGREKAALNNQIDAERELRKEKVKAVREDRDAKIKKLQEKQKTKEQARKAARERAKNWKHLQDDYKWLTSRLIKPNDQKHIPEEFRAALAGFLQNLDLQTERSKELELKYGKVSGATQNLINLRTRLGEIAKEDGTGPLEYDGYVFELMDAMLKKMEGPDEDINALDELTDQTLREVSTILRSIKHGIDNVDKARTEGQKKKISELGESTIASSKERIRIHGKYKVRQNFLTIPDQILNESMVTPRDMFNRIGGGLNETFMGIRHGFDKHVDNIDYARKFFAEIFNPYKKTGVVLTNREAPGSEIEKWRGTKSVQEFTLVNGEKISMSTAQIMSLYCSIKREQAAGHIYGGGIVVTEVTDNSLKTVVFGKPKEIQTGTAKITPIDAQSIVSKLTQEQKDMANKLLSFLNNECAEWGNETSMALYGYRKFTEPNYFPIKSSDQYLDSSFDAHDSVEKIRNFGFTKGTVVNANNPVVIDDIFSVVANHINQMSMYNAFAAPIADFTRVYNYRTEDEDGIKTISAKESIRAAWGDGVQKYISNFIEDLQNQQKLRRDPVDTMVNKLLANYKKATIGFNLRVALQQPTAIIRSFAMINPKYFANGNINVKANLADMKSHCQISKWKSWGFNQIDLANTLEDIMMNKEWSREDILTMKIYGALDDVTWSAIWAAVKNETKVKHPEVAYESEEFYAICNERASEIFDKTQVVDSPLHRSQIMRKKDLMSKMLVSFMAEPTRTYNMMRSAYAEAYTLWKSGDIKGARKIMATYTSVYVVNAFVCGAAAAMADALRHAGDDDDEGWWGYTLSNFWSNIKPWNMLPLFKELESYWNGWGTSNMAFEGVEALVKATSKIAQGDFSPKAFGDLLNAIGLVTGKPIKNVRRELKSIFGVEVFATTTSVVENDATTSEDENGLVSAIKSWLGKNSDNETGADKAEASSNGDDSENFDRAITTDDIDYGMYSYLYEDNSNGSIVNKAMNWLNIGDEEARETKAYDKSFNEAVAKAAEAGEGKVGEEHYNAINSAATKNYTKMFEAGDIETVKEMRRVVEAAGGDLDKFDENAVAAAKKALKKNLGEYGNTTARWQLASYLRANGVSDQEISDYIAESDTAKELQKAMATGDEDKTREYTIQLYEAGLTDESYTNLYNKRWTAVDAETTGTFSWPASGRVSSGFGSRWGTLHAGMDIAMPVGTEVTAADGGEVVYVGRDSSRGKYVDIKHDNGMITRYQHLSWWDVEKGQKVAKGQYIAKSGNTGKSTGPHLHFAIYRSTSHSGCTHGTAVDPSKYLESTT